MRLQNLLYIFFLVVMSLLLISGQRPEHFNRRKYHRHHCPHRRCMPLHARVPFP